MRPTESLDDLEAAIVREQDDGMGMALPFAFADVRDSGASTAGGDPICLHGPDAHVIVKHHDSVYGWDAVARDLDRFDRLDELERAAADAGIETGLGTVCHQARFKTPGGRPSDHAAAWNQARNRALAKYLLEPEQLGPLDDLVAQLRELGNTVAPMRVDHGRLAALRGYFLTAAERAAGPGLGADAGVRHLDRSTWLCDALVAGDSRGPKTPGDDDIDAFAAAVTDPGFASRAPDALYWTWWSVFRGSDEMLDAAVAACSASRDPLIASSAALAAELGDGRDAIGRVTGLQALRARLRGG